MAVLEDLAPEVVKTGMLLDSAIVFLVAQALEGYGLLAVVDPVMVAKGGALLLREEATKACLDTPAAAYLSAHTQPCRKPRN